jgi:hypothetical protein
MSVEAPAVPDRTVGKHKMKINVYGNTIEVIKKDNYWRVFYIGPEGKKRLADDLVIPSELHKDELLEYIADLCHEWETKANNKVEILTP